jgi:hypothetical protein
VHAAVVTPDERELIPTDAEEVFYRRERS